MVVTPKDRKKINDIQTEFTLINYEVCHYCKNMVYGWTRDEMLQGCGLVKNSNNKFARLTILGGDITNLKEKYGIDAINCLKGCDKFEPSGLPAHPRVLEEIIKNNSACQSIPSDSKAVETSWDFTLKMEGMNVNKSVNWSEIQ